MSYSFVLVTLLNISALSEIPESLQYHLPHLPVALVVYQEAGEKAGEAKEKAEPTPAKKEEPDKGAGEKSETDKKGDGKKDAPKKGEEQPIWTNMIVIMGAVFVFYYFIVMRPQQNERSKQKNLHDSMKKNDRVLTIGGMIGTIANISEDGNEITLKLDDNARVRMLRSSIRGPYQPADDKNKEDK